MKKILIITECLPDPINKHGIFKRLRSFLKAFDGCYTLDFLFFVSPAGSCSKQELGKKVEEVWGVKAHAIHQCVKEMDISGKSILTDYLAPIFNIIRLPKYRMTSGSEQVTFIENCLAKYQPDLIFAHRLDTICPLLLVKPPIPTIIFDLDDIEHKVLFRSIESPPMWLSKRLSYLHIPSLMLLERKAIKLAKKTFVCSEKDVKYLNRLYQTNNVNMIPNSIDIPMEFPMPHTQLGILYLGAFSYQPNVEAAEYLISNVWPDIVAKQPSAKLYIAGKSPENISSYSNVADNIIFTGFVENLDDLYAKVQVVCCPIFVAGGTRIKIIEAAAYGKAIVSTEMGAEGLEMEDGKEIILRNNADAIAVACIELLNNIDNAESLGKKARERVVKRFDIKHIIQLIRAHLAELKG